MAFHPSRFAFFRHIQEEIIAPGCGFIALARSGARCIAAAVFFRWGGRGLFKFGASEKRHQNLRPNNLAMWEGMRYLLHNGCRSLHFGRTAPGDEGLRRFKLSWNTREESLPLRSRQPHHQTLRSRAADELFCFPPKAVHEIAAGAQRACWQIDLPSLGLKECRRPFARCPQYRSPTRLRWVCTTSFSFFSNTSAPS